MKIKTYTKNDFKWCSWKLGEFSDLPEKAISEIKEDYKKIKAIPAKERSFENTILALERAGKNYGRMLSFMDFLAEVSPEEKVRNKANELQEKYSKMIVDVVYDEEIYKAILDYAKIKEKLEDDKRLLFKDTLRGYKRMGFDLPKAKREKLKRNLKELSKLSIAYGKNLNNYKDHIILKESETVGLPQPYLNNLKRDKKGNYIVSLEYPDIGPFLTNSPIDKKRKEIADKNIKKGGKKNIELLTKMIKLRHENAKILGYKNYAEYVLEERLAKNPKNVFKFLRDIHDKLLMKAKTEREEISTLKREITGNKKAVYEYYDGYYANELKKKNYNIDNEKVREYFPFEKVKQGLFETYETLFGVKFEEEKDISLWHKDARLYSVKDGGQIISYFAMDLFPREGKYGHAAAFPLITGHIENGEYGKNYVAPLTALVCNFPRPTKENPSLLSHGEVETLFHEFGHVMHSILTKARFESQAGFNVKWDFVEMPSQMLEQWVWHKEILKKISSHYKTGESLPDGLIDRMIKAKHFMTASHYLRQMILALFDMELHTKIPKKKIQDIYAVMTKKSTGFVLPKDQIFPASFGHIASGYAAGYYSYAWAECFAIDMFSRFEKEGLLNKKTGADYRKWILEKGGSMEELDLIRGFLGRAPNNKAFLRYIGIK